MFPPSTEFIGGDPEGENGQAESGEDTNLF